MKINWQENKFTIIGFGIIFIVLGIFGYILWNITREPIAEIPVQDTPVVAIPPIVDKQPEIVKEELPEYPITKVDTKGWEYRETKLGDVGIRYKVMNKDLDNRPDKFLDPHFDLGEYDIDGLMFGADNKERLGKGYDRIDINDCTNCGGGPYDPAPGRIDIDIVENPELSLSDIENILLNQTCDYTIKKADELMFPYTLNEKCSIDKQLIAYNSSSNVRDSQKIGDIINLRVSGKEILQYKNPFISTDKASQLIKYPIAIGSQDFSENNIDDPEIVFDNQLVFVIDLGNDKSAIITQSAYPEDNSQKANNLMYTILSTIEVL